MNTFLTIAQLARELGVSVHTLRYYERIGLIHTVARHDRSGHRFYSQADVQWIRFLQRLRATGMPIRQMLQYAELRREGNGDESILKRQTLLTAHAQKLEAQIALLLQSQQVLTEKIATYAFWLTQPKEKRIAPNSSSFKEPENEK